MGSAEPSETGFRAFRRRAKLLFALELRKPLAGALVDELNLGLIHQSKRHARFAGADLRFEFAVKLLQRDVAQIHRFRQPQAIQLVEMMTQGRIHLSFARRRFQHVLIAHAFLLRQFDREQQQRRDDPLLRRFLEIVPMQEHRHEPELGKAVLGPVAPGVGDQFVESAREIGLIFETQPPSQAQGLALDHLGGKRRMPDEELLQPNARQIHHHGHAGNSEIQRGLRGFEIEKPVAAGDFKQPVAQMRLHELPSPHEASVGEARQLRDIDVRHLLAVTLQAANERWQVRGAPMAVQFRHLHDDGGHHRMQPCVHSKKIGPMRYENPEVITVRKIKAQRQTGEHLSQREDIRGSVVMPHRFLPSAIADHVGGMLEFGFAVRDVEIRIFGAAFIVGRHLRVADHMECAGDRSLQFLDPGQIRTGGDGVALAPQHTGLIHREGGQPAQRSDQPQFVPRGHLMKKRDHGSQHIVGLETDAVAAMQE
jgi:hypothetical protein